MGKTYGSTSSVRFYYDKVGRSSGNSCYCSDCYSNVDSVGCGIIVIQVDYSFVDRGHSNSTSKLSYPTSPPLPSRILSSESKLC